MPIFPFFSEEESNVFLQHSAPVINRHKLFNSLSINDLDKGEPKGRFPVIV